MTASTRAPSRAALALALALAGGGAARAELVVLTDGAVLKVERFAARGERATLVFPGGGELELALERVERVVDDEIDPEAARPGAASAAPAQAFPIGFADGAPRPETPWSEAIFAAARRHGLNPALIAAVARVESAFDPRAVSSKGARGLMQLMPATGRRFGLRPHELFDPVKNLDAGTRYLAWLADRFEGDLARVLAGYHAGEGAVDRYGGVPPYRETRAYLRSVYARLGLSEGDSSAR
ncbi:MAG: soluble lytic murein transglycosylase-like protein [Acidobacteria bacterium]|jgi:soluble lytic murein transglycosylase-like protein|nr:soluble lytic murein transglycosylase-like protein [Acidobacteriota bacterium]